MKKRRRCELRSHRRRCLFYALFFLEKSKKSGKQNTGKKFKIPGFLKSIFRNYPRGILDRPILRQKVRKTPDFDKKSGAFMVAEAGLEPTTSGL